MLTQTRNRGPPLRSVTLVVLAGVVFAVAVRRIRIAVGMRRGDQAVIDAKRNRNKRCASKVVTTVGRAGRRHSIFADRLQRSPLGPPLHHSDPRSRGPRRFHRATHLRAENELVCNFAGQPWPTALARTHHTGRQPDPGPH